MQKNKTTIQTLTLPVEGMTCASCIARVEKALTTTDGIESASVNLATEKVTVSFDSTKADLGQLSRAVENAGYRLIVPSRVKENGRPESGDPDDIHENNFRRLKQEFMISALLAIPIMALSMIGLTEWFMAWSPFTMNDVNRILFVATTVVMVVSGKRFFAIAWKLARHGSADMNTLVAVGTGSAYLYSAFAVLFPRWLSITDPSGHIYFDTAATIITLILLGRLLEARAKRKTTDAIKNLINLQPKTARILRDGTEIDVPVGEVRRDDIFIVRPGEKMPVDGLILKGTSSP